MTQDPASEFQVFYAEHFQTVARAVYVTIGNEDSARETTQEAFARTWAHWATVVERERPVLYTLTVARNLIRRDFKRAMQVRRMASWTDTSENDVDETELVDLRSLVQRALSRLPIRQRWAVVLCDMVGLTSDEAAAVMSVSASTVRVHVTRARQTLRSALADHMEPMKHKGGASTLGGREHEG